MLHHVDREAEMPWNEYHPLGLPQDPLLDDEDQPIGVGACGWAECHREWAGCVCPPAARRYYEQTAPSNSSASFNTST